MIDGLCLAYQCENRLYITTTYSYFNAHHGKLNRVEPLQYYDFHLGRVVAIHTSAHIRSSKMYKYFLIFLISHIICYVILLYLRHYNN